MLSLIQYLHKFQLDAKYSTVSPTIVSMCIIASSAKFVCSNLYSGSAVLPEPLPRPPTWDLVHSDGGCTCCRFATFAAVAHSGHGDRKMNIGGFGDHGWTMMAVS
jgi:hypothetical protein